MERLEQVRNRCLIKSVLAIQKSWRRHKRRIQRRRNSAAVKIQSVWRGWRAKMNFQRIQEAVKVIQRTTKRYLALKRLQEECNIKLKSDTSVEEFFNVTLPHENPALKDNAPLNFPSSPLLRCFSSSKKTPRQFEFISSLVSRAEGSWFGSLETRPDQFTPQNYFSAPCSRQISFNFTRGYVSPLAMLMCNFSSAKPRSEDTDKPSVRMLPVNKSSAIISRRDIEKMPVAFHCKGTPLPHANRRPHSATTINMGLAAIRELDYEIE